MNDLVKLTYDVFGHVIPGMIIFFSLSLLYAPQDLIPWLDAKAAIEADKGSVIIIISYIIGFAIGTLMAMISFAMVVGKVAAFSNLKDSVIKEIAELKNMLFNPFSHAHLLPP